MIKKSIGKTDAGNRSVDAGIANRAAKATSSHERLDESALVELMHKLEQTQENMYSCEESFALLDEYVELVTTGEDAARLMPLVKNHLDACPHCHEHYDILLEILRADAA